MVREAMDSLKNDGLPTSVPRIREILGKGSHSTIQRYKKEVDAEFALQKNVKVIPRSDFEILQQNVNDLRNIVNSLQIEVQTLKKNETLGNKTVQGNEKSEELEVKLESVQAEAQETIDNLTKKLEESNAEIARQAKDYSNLQTKYAALKTSTQKKTTQRSKEILEGKAKRVK